MNPSTTLKCLTLDLFIYDLQSGLGESSEKIAERRDRFWKRIPISQEQQESAQSRENSLSDYIELLSSPTIKPLIDPWEGYYYPVLLNDTYALLVDCSGKANGADDWQLLPLDTQIHQIKTTLLNSVHHGQGNAASIGQSWLLYAQLTDSSQDPKAIARDCYDALKLASSSNWDSDYRGEGLYRGGRVFELESPDLTPDGINQNQHIQIFLFSPQTTSDELKGIIGQLHRDLIRLFHDRNKILLISEQSSRFKITLKRLSTEVQELTHSISNPFNNGRLDLNQLQKNLAEAILLSNNYQTYLGYLQEQQASLEINAENYKTQLKNIGDRDLHSDLTFLEKFTEFTANRNITQLKSDNAILKSGLKPLESAIPSIQSIIELEKTRNDRTLNQTVAMASVGIGTASLTATTFNDQAKEIVKTFLPVSDKDPHGSRKKAKEYRIEK
jgi:hypothetical protein